MTPKLSQSKEKRGAQTVRRFFLAAAVGCAAWLLWLNFGEQTELAHLAKQEAWLRDLLNRRPLLVYSAAFAIYVTVTGLSVPGASALSLAYAWFFGFVPALTLISFASTAGASVAFLLSRYLLRDFVQQRFGSRLSAVNAALDTEGSFYLFSLRLIPVIPFFVINLVMGLTAMKPATFWWVSQIGMLPGTAVYVYAGSSVPDLQTLSAGGPSDVFTPRLLAAFVLLAMFPFLVRKFVTLASPQK